MQIMIKSFLIAGAALGASVVSASAGTAFYWVGTSGSEFNAENAWRHEISSSQYDYVAPASFDSLEALKNSSSSAPTTGTTSGTTYSEGYDFLLGGNPSGSGTADMTIAVNSYYYVNGLQASQYCLRVNYTFDFGAFGAVYSYYQMKFENSVGSLKVKVDSSSVSTTANSSRTLFGSYGGGTYTDLTISETNLSNLSLDLGDSNTFWTVSDTVYTDSTIEQFSGSSLVSPTAALFYSATDKTLSVVYMIPEPSAFGLLAGAGALALVAAHRRRRSRKAA